MREHDFFKSESEDASHKSIILSPNVSSLSVLRGKMRGCSTQEQDLHLKYEDGSRVICNQYVPTIIWS